MKPDPRAEKPARRIQKRGKIQKAHRLSGRKVRGVVVVETGLEAIAGLGAELDPRIQRNPEVVDRILTRLPLLGFRIVLLTEADLRGAYEHNVRALAPLVGCPIPRLPEIVGFCQQPRSFEEARAHLSLTNNDLLAAIAQGHLSCNLRLNRITPRTLVQAARDAAYLWVPNL